MLSPVASVTWRNATDQSMASKKQVKSVYRKTNEQSCPTVKEGPELARSESVEKRGKSLLTILGTGAAMMARIGTLA